MRGTKEDCNNILGKIRSFLGEELHLNLSETKTEITSVNHGSALFLGTKINRKSFVSFGRKKHGFPIRDNKTISLIAPIDRVMKKLKNAKIIVNGKPAPR